MRWGTHKLVPVSDYKELEEPRDWEFYVCSQCGARGCFLKPEVIKLFSKISYWKTETFYVSGKRMSIVPKSCEECIIEEIIG